MSKPMPEADPLSLPAAAGAPDLGFEPRDAGDDDGPDFDDASPTIAAQGFHFHEVIPAPRPRRNSTNWVAHNLGRPLSSGGIRQSVMTLASTAIGGGLLTLPFAMKTTGMGLGFVLVLLGALASGYGIEILLRKTADASGYNIRSYGDLVGKKLGNGFGTFFDLLLSIYGLGVQVAFMNFIGDFASRLCEFFFPTLTALNDKTLWVWLSLLMTIPLSVPKNLSALKYCSVFAAFALMFTSFVIVVKTPSNFIEGDRGSQIEIVNVNWKFFEAVGNFVFAFNCHLNVSPVAAELSAPSSQRIAKITVASVMLQLVFYLLIATCGYLSFGDLDTQENILDSYPNNDALAIISRISLTITLFFGLPINLNPTLRAFLRVLDDTLPSGLHKCIVQGSAGSRFSVAGTFGIGQRFGQGPANAAQAANPISDSSSQGSGARDPLTTADSLAANTTAADPRVVQLNDITENRGPSTTSVVSTASQRARRERKLHDVAMVRLVSAVFYTVLSAALAEIFPHPSEVIGLVSLAIGTLMMFILPAVLSGAITDGKCVFLMVFGVINIIGAVIMILEMFGVIKETDMQSVLPFKLHFGWPQFKLTVGDIQQGWAGAVAGVSSAFGGH